VASVAIFVESGLQVTSVIKPRTSATAKKEGKYHRASYYILQQVYQTRRTKSGVLFRSGQQRACCQAINKLCCKMGLFLVPGQFLYPLVLSLGGRNILVKITLGTKPPW
jgi:hypothetical protein